MSRCKACDKRMSERDYAGAKDEDLCVSCIGDTYANNASVLALRGKEPLSQVELLDLTGIEQAH